MTKTKLLCTIGPASDSSEVLKEMINAGMDAARINTSHGTLEEYEQKIKRIRRLANIPIHMDTAGPQIRLVSKKPILLKKELSIEVGFDSSKELFFSRDFFSAVKTGAHILLSDGLAEAVVTKKNTEKKTLKLKTMNEITLKGNMHSNIPSVYLDIPILCSRDQKVLELAKRLDVDFINLSFTRRKQDILTVKRALAGSTVGIIAKIENQEGVEKIDEILSEADGVMVARGDLGLEIASERVPIVQKMIVKKCNQAGKPCIIATQMLASMVSNKLPTRAETSDVANAILDGTDCVMLSNETAVGKYPVLAVKEMKRISKHTEPFVKESISEDALEGIPELVSESIYSLSKRLPVKKIVAITRSGFTARIISRFKPTQEIIAVTDRPDVERKLKISFGVKPVFIKEITERKKISRVARWLYKNGMLNSNDLVIFSAGIYQGKTPTSNTIQIHRVNDLVRHTK